MMTQKPVAEILMATYNGEKYVREQIDSILAQTDTCWHLTVSDDGSTDSTPGIIDEYAAKYPEKISRHVSGRRFGNARDHFFYLMRTCAAEYMFFCDQDDVWYPGKIEKMMDVMLGMERGQGKSAPLLVFTDQTPTDGELNPLAPSLMRYQQQYFETIDYRALLMQNIVTGGAMAINRALADIAARCTDETKTMMHDWWLAVVAARFGEVIYLDETTSDYRQHGTNSVGAKDVRSVQHILHKLSRLGDIRKTTLEKKRQAQVFMDTYGEELGEEDHAFLDPFVRPRSGMLFYMKHRALIHGFFRLAGMMVLG